MTYQVELKPKARKFLSSLSVIERQRINERLKQISNDPRSNGVIKLSGKTPEQYRIRQGDYRILYSIHDNVLVVEVIDIDHRKNIFRGK
jgi:mRNA interferase RelE/StbE